MPRLTIIIPSVGNPAEFEDTLASVLQNRPDDCRVVVPVTKEYDDPYELRDEVSFPVYPEVEGVVELFNAVLNECDSRIVHLLQCGIEVSDGWCDAAVERFDDAKVAAVSPAWRLPGKKNRYVLGEYWTASGRCRRVVCRRRSSHRVPAVTSPLPAAGFFRTTSLRTVGGLCTSVPESLCALAAGLRQADLGWHAAAAPESVVFGHWHARSSSGFVHGRALERLRRTHRGPRRSPGVFRFAARVVSAAGEPGWSRRAAHLMGTLQGRLERGVEKRYREWLDEVSSRLEIEAAESARVADAAPEPVAQLRRAA